MMEAGGLTNASEYLQRNFNVPGLNKPKQRETQKQKVTENRSNHTKTPDNQWSKQRTGINKNLNATQGCVPTVSDTTIYENAVPTKRISSSSEEEPMDISDESLDNQFNIDMSKRSLPSMNYYHFADEHPDQRKGRCDEHEMDKQHTAGN